QGFPGRKECRPCLRFVPAAPRTRGRSLPFDQDEVKLLEAKLSSLVWVDERASPSNESELGRTLPARGPAERPSRSVTRGKGFLERLVDVRRTTRLPGAPGVAMEARQDFTLVEAKKSLLGGTDLMDVHVIVSS